MAAAVETSERFVDMSRPHSTSLHAMRIERRILVLYVGGTIGMMKNAEGALEPRAGYLTEQMNCMRELKESAEIAPFDIIEYEQLLDSSDMNMSDYLRIARDIETHYYKYTGFVIAHGSDTMHFTASALSFLLYNLGKPVIITGSMVSLAEAFNDARRNIIIGMLLASNPQICEVCVFFNHSLFRGNRCDKVRHTYSAFHSPNYPALGEMEGTSFVVRERYLLPQPTGPMRILSDLSGRVICFPITPEADIEALIALLRTNAADGSNRSVRDTAQRVLVNAVLLILDGVGSPTDPYARRLRRLCNVADERDIVLCVASHELCGTFRATEVRRLREISPSLVYVRDMCPSTAEVKLMYLFGRKLSSAQVRALMPVNIRGEVTPPKAAHL